MQAPVRYKIGVRYCQFARRLRVSSVGACPLRVCLLIAALLFAHQVWAITSLPALNKLADGPARISALIINLDNHETLARITPWQRLIPASVTKLYVAAATLQRWGPNHRFTTKLLTNGSVQNGVLKGDLVFLGAGDPDFDHARLWRLIAQLRQQGIQRVTGNIIINQSLFGDVECVTIDRCEARKHSRDSYDAPLSSAGVDFSTVPVTVYPADEPGKPANVTLMPPAMSGFEIASQVETESTGKTTAIQARRTRIPTGNHIRLSGQIAVDHPPESLYLSVSHPARYTGRMLQALATMSGITITGDIRVTSQHPDKSLAPIASIQSPALITQLRGMLMYSNNYMADTLTLDLAAYSDWTSNRPLSLTNASQILEELAYRANQEAADWLPPKPDSIKPMAIHSGSGLTFSNQLAASDIVALLTYMHGQADLFTLYASLLPTPGFSLDSRLQNSSIAWSTRVRAKTGTLTEPVSVFGFAGYLRLPGGNRGAFAILINAEDAGNSIPAHQSIRAIRQDLLRFLGHS